MHYRLELPRRNALRRRPEKPALNEKPHHLMRRLSAQRVAEASQRLTSDERTIGLRPAPLAQRVHNPIELRQLSIGQVHGDGLATSFCLSHHIHLVVHAGTVLGAGGFTPRAVRSAKKRRTSSGDFPRSRSVMHTHAARITNDRFTFAQPTRRRISAMRSTSPMSCSRSKVVTAR